MAVPDFQSFFKPLLDIATDGKEHTIQETREIIAKKMNLTQKDLEELLLSGTQTKFDNRVAWAKSDFTQAKVLESPRLSYFKITDRGCELHKKGHERIDIKILDQYLEFVAFHTAGRAKLPKGTDEGQDTGDETPEEVLQKAYQSIRNDLATELLEKIKQNSPKFFERLVADFMVALGYGGSLADAGRSIGQSGDEEIDGIIKEDRLGLDLIYLQAKRWNGAVGPPKVQKFAGALQGKRARKGVYITRGKFTDDAVRYADSIDPKVILVDGITLASMMIDHGLGTTTTATYEIKRVDSDYFVEE